MSAELIKLAKVLESRGYAEGGKVIESFGEALLKARLIPEALGEMQPLPKDRWLPPFSFVRLPEEEQPRQKIYEIDALKLKTRTRNPLIRSNHTTIESISSISDNELLRIYHLGKTGLEDIRRGLEDFRNEVVAKRQSHGITDGTPVEIPFPTKKSN